MSFTTKVKTTNQLFDATKDLGADGTLCRNACLPLQEGTNYAGYLFDAYPRSESGSANFSKPEWTVFPGQELEEFPLAPELMLRDVRKRVRRRNGNLCLWMP
jgi:hypothetical protein